MLDVNKELQEYRPVDLEQQQEPAKAGPEEELPEMVRHISRLLDRMGKEQFKASRQLENIFSLLEEEQEQERVRETESAKVRQELEGVEKEKEALLQSILEMADALEDIYRYAQRADEKAWKEQLALQWQKTGKQLEQLGIRRLEGAGDFFDPRLHTAGEVKAYPGVAHGQILDVLKSGYSFGDEIIRKAEVVVNRGTE